MNPDDVTTILRAAGLAHRRGDLALCDDLRRIARNGEPDEAVLNDVARLKAAIREVATSRGLTLGARLDTILGIVGGGE